MQDTSAGEAAVKASPRLWVLLLAGVLLPPLVAYGLVSAWGSPEKGVGTAPKSKAASAPGKEACEHPEELEEAPNPSQVPGDLLSDVHQALSEGEVSGLVHLETQKEQALFESLRNARPQGGLNGLAFVRVKKRPDGAELYDVQGQKGDSLGMVLLKRIEDRWRVTGFGSAGEALQR